MNYSIIGCGGTGLAIAINLTRDNSTTNLICIDSDQKKLSKVKRVLGAINSRVSIELKNIDARQSVLIEKAIFGSKVAINAASPQCNMSIMRACLNAEVNYIDLASNPFDYPGLEKGTTLDEQFALRNEFESKNLLAVTNTGYSPGFTDLVCKDFVSRQNVDSLKSVKIYFGEIIKASKLVCSWSPYTLMLEAVSPSTAYSNGKIIELGMNESLKKVEFPKPIGTLKVKTFNGHPELRTITEFLGVPVDYLEVGGGMFLNNLDLNDMIVVALSNQTKKSIKFEGDIFEILAKSFEPSDLFAENFKKGIIQDEIFCSIIQIEGLRSGKKISYKMLVQHDLKEVLKKMPEVSIATFVVSVVPSILTAMISKGDITQKGVIVPAQLENASSIIEHAKKSGLNVTEELK